MMIGLYLSLIEFIFWILIIYTVIKKIFKNKKNAGNNTQSTTQNVNQNVNSKNWTYTNSSSANDKRYSTVSSHYSNETLNGNGSVSTGNTYSYGDDHNHTYQHKVEPIKEATVMQKHYEMQKIQEEKRQERENMYNEGTSGYARREGGYIAKNGDYGESPKANETSVICSYCGANNILPRSAALNAYTCYFCRLNLGNK